MIICILPISWCLNILSNSTTLLKILEWQSEANYFTIRVRGKQWYWVYKFDIKSVMSNLGSSNVLKKIGNQTNYIKTITDMDYTYYTFVYGHWNRNFLTKLYDDNLPQQWEEEPNSSFNTKIKYKISNFSNNGVGKFFNSIEPKTQLIVYNTYPLQNVSTNTITESHINNLTPEDFMIKNVHFDKTNNFYLDATISRWWRDSIFKNNELKLQKIPSEMLLNSNNNILQFKYLSKKMKKFTGNYYSVIKQKSKIDWHKSSLDIDLKNFTNIFYASAESLMSNTVNILDTKQIQLFNNMRLLKINTILVLPSNIHINAITNSFDVIHSWFLPGLGLKMDCVPGRSTHHTLYIDNPGMYYGQCAEICGRFHHHMPIRICAMLYEHYFLWWYHVFSRLLIVDDVEIEKSKFTSRMNVFVK